MLNIKCEHCEEIEKKFNLNNIEYTFKLEKNDSYAVGVLKGSITGKRWYFSEFSTGRSPALLGEYEIEFILKILNNLNKEANYEN